MLAKRIIACLDVAGGKVVKGVKFEGHRVMGEIVPLAQKYSAAGIDELVFYDIAASPEGRTVNLDWIRSVAREINIPFCVAGGIKSVEQAEKVLHAGADKVSINTPALQNPNLINELAAAFGDQCVVVGVDSIFHDGKYRVKQFTGDPNQSRFSNQITSDWVVEAQERGAGEIVLNCMDTDGVKTGYHIEHLAEVRQLCHVPLIASGGAGEISHFADVFQQADVDGALAATVFHSGSINVQDLKQHLNHQNISVRYEP